MPLFTIIQPRQPGLLSPEDVSRIGKVERLRSIVKGKGSSIMGVGGI